MGRLGIPGDAFEGAGGEAEEFAVWAENRDAAALLVACQTQWRVTIVAGAGGAAMIWQGLDYSAAETAARGLGLRLRGRLFQDLRIMEAAALDVLNGG